jgi:hypothetical protein
MLNIETVLLTEFVTYKNLPEKSTDTAEGFVLAA